MENIAYSFLAGLYIGSYTNFFSDLVITGLILYIVKPNLFTTDNLNIIKNYTFNTLGIKIKKSDIQQIQQLQEIENLPELNTINTNHTNLNKSVLNLTDLPLKFPSNWKVEGNINK